MNRPTLPSRPHKLAWLLDLPSLVLAVTIIAGIAGLVTYLAFTPTAYIQSISAQAKELGFV